MDIEKKVFLRKRLTSHRSYVKLHSHCFHVVFKHLSLSLFPPLFLFVKVFLSKSFLTSYMSVQLHAISNRIIVFSILSCLYVCSIYIVSSILISLSMYFLFRFFTILTSQCVCSIGIIVPFLFYSQCLFYLPSISIVTSLSRLFYLHSIPLYAGLTYILYLFPCLFLSLKFSLVASFVRIVHSLSLPFSEKDKNVLHCLPRVRSLGFEIEQDLKASQRRNYSKNTLDCTWEGRSALLKTRKPFCASHK